MIEDLEDDDGLFARNTTPPSVSSAPSPPSDGAALTPTPTPTPTPSEPSATPAPAAPAARPAPVTPIEPPPALRATAERYTRRQPLGRGGMGEVMLCRDHTIGRDVAMKLIRPRTGRTTADLHKRFVQEARVQGQLEHPAIVPVYDVGVGGDGAPYFTMKCVRGVSLAHVLRGLRAGDGELAARYSQRRLLTLFSNVCMAVHFAHEKGVVHRDLKPSNIMLGDFGEVYVLDWGVAAVREAAGSERAIDPAGDAAPGQTLGGAVMGTPGYMAPEQVRAAADVDARADVYALGAILFELCTLERMHAVEPVAERLRLSLETDGVRPSTRSEREVAPELDRLCYDATRLDRELRPASAKALSLAVEAFLDGDRDLALRREAAAVHTAAAEAAVAAATAAPGDEHRQRARAMREVAAALGLDPGNEAARRILVRLIAEPPATVPPAAEADMAANSLRAYRLAGRASLVFYAGYLLYLPLLLWMGVRDQRLFALGWISIAACALAAWVSLRRPPRRLGPPLVHLAVSTFTVGAISVVFGPFILVPMVALGMCVSYIASIGHARGLVPVASCLAVLVPALLEWTGVLPRSYVFEGGRWIVLPKVFFISPVATQAFVVTAIVGTIAPACMFVLRLRRAYAEAERKLQLQAWQLRQILPDDAAR